jgi:hypothetical protein
MEDYMVDYVFGDGSKPRTPPRSREAIAKLEEWIKAKGIVPRNKKGRYISRRSMAFAIGKNLSKVGYAGYNYRTEDFETDLSTQIEFLLNQPQYEDLALNTQIQEIIDRINTLGQRTYNIALGRE